MNKFQQKCLKFVCFLNNATKLIMSLQRGVNYLNEGKLDEALIELNLYITDNPTDIKGLYHRGIVLRKQGEFKKSLVDFNRCLELAPDDVDLLCDRAITYYNLKENKLCLKDMDRAVELDPNNPFRYSSRAYIKGHMKYTHDAIKDYQKALELDPEDAVTLNNLGLLEEELGRKEAAQRRFEKADRLNQGVKFDGPPEEIKKIIEESTPIKNIEEGNQLEAERQKKREFIAPIAPPKKPEYLKTAIDIFTKKAVFKEFITFVKNLLSGKK